MKTHIIVGIIGFVLIILAIRAFIKEMTILKMESENRISDNKKPQIDSLKSKQLSE